MRHVVAREPRRVPPAVHVERPKGPGVLAPLVAFSALAFGRPLLLSAVGGFPELAAAGAAQLVPPGDPGALHDALRALLADPAARERLAAGARAAAAERFGWDAIARRHLELYRALVAEAA